MSIHPSLSSSEKDKQQRSVLKRIERIKSLKEKDKWQEGNSIFGLPKLKIVKVKFKKEKAAAEKPEEAGVAATESTTPPEGDAKAGSSAKTQKTTKSQPSSKDS